MDAENKKPRARDTKLIERQVESELIVYDSNVDKAHCLNETAARVWRACDGNTTVAEIATGLPGDVDADEREDLVWAALEQLEKADLLEEPVVPPELAQQASRRRAVRRLAFASVVGFPLMASIVAPTAAQVGSGPMPK